MVQHQALHRVVKQVRTILALSLCFTLVSVPVGAAPDPDSESITMSPTSRSYRVDAGKSINDKLTIVNDGAKAYDFLVYARPYSVSNEAYDPNFTATPTNADVYGWVQFPKTKYHLESGKSTTVDFTINVPAAATPGGHYGVIFVETQPAANEAIPASGVIRKKRVGSIIYATVNGAYKTAGEAVSAEIPFWQVQPPLHTTVTAKNTGNTDFTDSVRLTVKDVFGNVKYDATKDYQVLPQTTRKINLDWSSSSWFGFYKVETAQKILGKSTASSGYVLMMPRFVPIVFIVILLIGGAYAWFRRRKH
jgi:hypothetical protein